MKMMKFNAGYYVNELIQELNVTKQDFANQLQITVIELNDLIEGKVLITNEIAQKLSKMLVTSTDVWLKL
jgi:addiction module HigA family antidote